MHRPTQEESEGALRRVLAEFEALGRPVWHCLGNHCLYNLPRPTLNQRLRCALLRCRAALPAARASAVASS
jgi:hypothetical protein